MPWERKDDIFDMYGTMGDILYGQWSFVHGLIFDGIGNERLRKLESFVHLRFTCHLFIVPKCNRRKHKQA